MTRHLHAVGKPGASSEPRHAPRMVEREIPVTAIARADGSVEIVDTDADPCFGCACCAKWAKTLEELRAGIGAHDTADHAATPVDACLVCMVVSGEIDRIQ